MKHLHLALSWRTETIKPIRHSREGVTGLSGRPTGPSQADSDILLRATATFRGQAVPKVLFHFARTVRRSDG
jgi:hypothetical protein